MDLKESPVPTCPPDQHFPGWKVEIVDAGESVSRLWIVDKTMRIAGSEIRIGGVSTVGTDEKYRGRGLATRVMNAALELMRREDILVTVLHGIKDFYHRSGYVCCMPDYEISLSAADAELGLPWGNLHKTETLRLRESRPEDLPALARLYNRLNADRPGSIVRDPARWRGFPRSVGWFTKPGLRLAVDARDRLRGYFVFDAEGGLCRVAEAGATPGAEAAVFRATADFLAARAKESGTSVVTLMLPPDHALALYCRDLGCVQTTAYARNGQFMGRILDARAFAEKIAGGLFTNARKRGALSKALAKVEPGALLQLAMGYRSADDLRRAGRLKASAADLEILSACFPPRFAHMSWPDRF